MIFVTVPIDVRDKHAVSVYTQNMMHAVATGQMSVEDVDKILDQMLEQSDDAQQRRFFGACKELARKVKAARDWL